MVRSVISGAMWGGVVAGLGIATASVLAPLPGREVPRMPAPSSEAPAHLPGLTEQDKQPVVAPEPEPEPKAEAEPEPDPPGPEPEEPPHTDPAAAPAVEDEARVDEPDPAPENIVEALAPKVPAEQEAPDQPAPELAEGKDPAPAMDTTPESLAEAPATVAPPPEPLPARPQPGLKGETEGVTSGRLPRIGDDPAPEQPAPETLAEDPATRPALERNARAFANPGDLPLLALLLRDDPGFAGDLVALARGDLALTLVIDPTLPGAADRAALWRAAGQEVAFDVSGLPQGGVATDFEVALEAIDTDLDVALAFVVDTQGSFQTDRARATAAAPALAARGYGLVTWEQGLNPADQAARKAGVATARLFRAIDGEGEPASVVRRQIDRGVFKAAQDGQAAILGTLRPETIEAIADWAASARAGQVAVAPLSAVLKAAP